MQQTYKRGGKGKLTNGASNVPWTACTSMNTYINVCTIKSILVNNTARMHTQRKTFMLVHFHMQMPPTPEQLLRLVSSQEQKQNEKNQTKPKNIHGLKIFAKGRAVFILVKEVGRSQVFYFFIFCCLIRKDVIDLA